MTLKNCHDCGAKPGETHDPGCDVERCSCCGGQRLGCGCDPGAHDPEESKWTGEWPGVAECRKLGWYSKFSPGAGWVQCSPDDPDGSEDLNRWAVHNMRRKNCTCDRKGWF